MPRTRISPGSLCGSRHAARRAHEVFPIRVADDWGALRHAVAHGVGELDFVQHLFNLGVECRAAYDDLVALAAQSRHQAVAELAVDGVAQHRHFTQHLDFRAVVLAEDALAHNLLDEHRHDDDEVGLDLFECLEDDGCGQCACDERHVDADAEFVHQLEGHAVQMCRREQRDDVHAGVQVGQHLFGEGHVAPHRPFGNHDAFGGRCRSRRVVDHQQVVRLVAHVVDVVGADVGTVAERDKVIGHQHELALGVGHEPLDHLGREFVQQRDGHCAIGEGGQQGDAPLCAVAATDGEAETGLVAGLAPHLVIFCNLTCHVAVGERLSLIVREGGQIPVVTDALFEHRVQS